MIQIPPQYYRAVEKFIGLSKSSMERLTDTLRKAAPQLRVRDLASTVASRSSLSEEDSVEIVSMLASLYSARTTLGISSREFAEQLSVVLKQADPKKVRLTKVNWEEFKKNIERILSFEDSLGVTSKALAVMSEHTSLFWDARILTDLRPVFESDPEKIPSVAVITHTLKISYSEAGTSKEFFVALDAGDLKKLQSILNRAIVKEQSLRSVIKQSGLTCLEPK